MDPIKVALTGVLAPAVLAGVVLLVAALVGRRAGSGLKDLEAPRWAGVALAAGFGLGFALTLEWPALPPVDVTQVGPWAAVFAAPLGFLPGRWRAVATGALGLGLGLFLAAPTQSGGELVLTSALVVGAVVAMERGLASIGDEGRAGVLVSLVFVSGVAAVVLLSDTASLAVTTGGLAAGLGAVFTMSLVAPGLGAVGRAGPVIALVAATHLFGSTLYAGGSLGPVLVLAVAPLVVALGVRWGRPLQGLRRALVPAVLVGVTVGGAGAWAASRYLAEDEAPAVDAGGGETPDDYGY